MASDKPIRVAIIGLGFGAEFIPIYQNYPGAEMYGICRRDQKGLDECGDRYKIAARYTDYKRDAQGPEDRRRPHQFADPGSRLDVGRGPQGGQARRLHRADGHERRRVPADRRGPAEERQGLHDDGDRRLQPRIPVRQGAVRQGRAGPAPVPAGQPSAGHGRLARLLAGPAAHVVRDPLREPLPGHPGQARRERRLPRVGSHPRGPDRPSTAARSPSRRPRSPSRGRTSRPRSPAASSTRRGSTARASTPTAARRASNGSRSRARSR